MVLEPKFQSIPACILRGLLKPGSLSSVWVLPYLSASYCAVRSIMKHKLYRAKEEHRTTFYLSTITASRVQYKVTLAYIECENKRQCKNTDRASVQHNKSWGLRLNNCSYALVRLWCACRLQVVEADVDLFSGHLLSGRETRPKNRKAQLPIHHPSTPITSFSHKHHFRAYWTVHHNYKTSSIFSGK